MNRTENTICASLLMLLAILHAVAGVHAGLFLHDAAFAAAQLVGTALYAAVSLYRFSKA